MQPARAALLHFVLFVSFLQPLLPCAAHQAPMTPQAAEAAKRPNRHVRCRHAVMSCPTRQHGIKVHCALPTLHGAARHGSLFMLRFMLCICTLAPLASPVCLPLLPLFLQCMHRREAELCHRCNPAAVHMQCIQSQFGHMHTIQHHAWFTPATTVHDDSSTATNESLGAQYSGEMSEWCTCAGCGQLHGRLAICALILTHA